METLKELERFIAQKGLGVLLCSESGREFIRRYLEFRKDLGLDKD